MKKIVGITGGFCTGKTEVSTILKKLGAKAIDADRIVHNLYKKNRKVKNQIRKMFGNEVFTGGEISRHKLGVVAFKNKNSLKTLCKVIHPHVIRKMKNEIKKSKSLITVVDAPLLIEANLVGLFDYVIVVKSSVATQLARSKKRGFTRRDFYSRHNAQIPLHKKMKYADFVISNETSKSHMRNEVRKIWRKINK